MYTHLISNGDEDPDKRHTVLFRTINVNDLELVTNHNGVFNVIQSWYTEITDRKFKEKKSTHKFIKYRGKLEGARKCHVFGELYWRLIVTDHILEIGYIPVTSTWASHSRASEMMFIKKAE